MGKVLNFGAKNLHYAKKTGDTTYDTPKPLAGLVKFSLKVSGNAKEYHADDITYRKIGTVEGYEVEAELYDISQADLMELFNYTKSENKLLVETTNPTLPSVALLAENTRDDEQTQKAVRFVLYDVVFERPDFELETIKGSDLNPVTFKIKGKATAIKLTGYNFGVVRATVTEETQKEVFDNWYKSVQLPTAIGG